MDRYAHKQLLLARIAHERLELQRDVARLREAARPSQWLRAALGAGLGRSAFAGGADIAAWLGVARVLLRRYRFAAALLGAGAAALRGRRGWGRVVKLGVLGAAAWFGWRIVRRDQH
jgi:hypothetical protein